MTVELFLPLALLTPLVPSAVSLPLVTAVLHKEEGKVTAAEDTVAVVVRLAERAAQLVTAEADEGGDEIFVREVVEEGAGEEEEEVEGEGEEEEKEEEREELLVLVTSFNKRFDLAAGGLHSEGLVLLRFTFEEVLLWLAW